MDYTNVVLELVMNNDQSAINSIIENTVRDYAQEIVDIAEDIYDSCIQYFYATYTPMVYDRHGDLSGFNLYSANEIGLNKWHIDVAFEEDNLLPYKGKTDKRAAVLESVFAGVRARKSPRMPGLYWRVSYPNTYSQLSKWQSSGHTLNAIYNDFCTNIVNDTKDDFYEILNSYI